MKYCIIIIGVLTVSLTFAKEEELKTKFNFEGLSIKGRYNIPSEVLIKAEGKKSINDLLFVRKDFKDRIKQSLGYK